MPKDTLFHKMFAQQSSTILVSLIVFYCARLFRIQQGHKPFVCQRNGCVLGVSMSKVPVPTFLQEFECLFSTGTFVFYWGECGAYDKNYDQRNAVSVARDTQLERTRSANCGLASRSVDRCCRSVFV